jgi:hypothetical protein
VGRERAARSHPGRKVVLYLHGFASGPGSAKGRAFEDHLAPLGCEVRRLDLRLPDRDRLRISAMIARVEREARAVERPVLIGSSLGGLVAAQVAARVAGVRGAVLMAPAYRLAERWAESIGPERMRRWSEGEPIEAEDHSGGPPLRVDVGFYTDALSLEPFPLPTCPLLVFHGRRDDTVGIETSRELAERALRAELVELDDGHALIESLPEMLPRARAFIEGLWERDDELERSPER